MFSQLRERKMLRENLFILIAIIVPFVVFALTLAWGDLQTRRIGK
jgi:hypothetical protein